MNVAGHFSAQVKSYDQEIVVELKPFESDFVEVWPQHHLRAQSKRRIALVYIALKPLQLSADIKLNSVLYAPTDGVLEKPRRRLGQDVLGFQAEVHVFQSKNL